MSTVFSKNKEKRSRSSSNEANNSFVKNVTSRVSGLLPATITKWFSSSPSSSNANGSVPAADATDSSTEDEAPESPIITQPPAKRIRYSSPGKYNHFAPSDANCVPSNIDTIEQITPYSTIQSPPGRNTFRRETNYVSTPIRAPTDDPVLEGSDRDMSFKSQHSFSNTGPTVALKRKSLFDTSSNREASMRALRTTANNTMVDPKAPCFKPILLGSPFYPGHTMYGGASMYINQPNIKQRKTALVNESKSSENTTMSHSARRVMDLLENYSSPLMEAKRISQYVKSAARDSLDNSSISGSPYANKVLSYKTQELHVPNIATILRLKQKSRLMDTTNAARQIIASHSSTMSDYLQPYPPSNNPQETEKGSSSKLTTKVKTRVTRQNRGENIDTEESFQPVNLPTAVLQIDKNNLPKFTFGSIPQSSTSNSTSGSLPKFTFASMPETKPVTGSPISFDVGDSAISKPEIVFSNDSYKFSSPVRIPSESDQPSTTPPKFAFGSPERGIDKPKTNKKKDLDSSIVVGTPKVSEKISSPKTKDWQCPDCWVNNKTDIKNCVCCGAKQPTKESAKTSKCTICKLADSQTNSEKCVNCDKINLNNSMSLPALKPIDSTKWKCEDCWVSNDENVDKCICCGGKNPKKSSSVQGPIAASTDNDWKCDDCWIKNKGSVDKCAACGGARPGAKQAVATSLPTNSGTTMFGLKDNGLKNIVKSQNDKWECPSCLVRNENNRTKCVCCESHKPGTAKESEKKSFNFGMTTNTSFKFGIDPKAQEVSAIKVPEAKPAESIFNKVEESETNNNVLPKTPSFSFGIPAKKTEVQLDATKENKVTEPPKVAGFTFGIPKTQPKTETAVTPMFGSASKLTESNPDNTNIEKEKPQEVPKIDFKFPVTKESPKPAIFGTQENKDKPAVIPTTMLNQLANTEKKDAPSSLTLPPAVTSSESAPQKTFTFGGLGSTTNMFAAPASTTSTTPSFSSAVQSVPAAGSLFPKPESTTAPALSMFQKPEVPTTSTISLFQKSETATTAASLSLAATAPVFSFGSNSSRTTAPPSFGGNGVQSATPPAFGGNGIQTVTSPTFGGNGTQTAAPPAFGGNGQQNTVAPTFGSNGAQSATPATFGGNGAQSSTPATFGGNGTQIATPTFGSNAQNATPTEKPKFNFTFGGNTPLFNNTSFGAPSDNNPNANKFGITGSNLGGNGLSAPNPLAGGNGLDPSKLGASNELNATSLNAGTEMNATPNLFGAPAQKENLWSTTSNNSNNLFVTSASTNPLQKPATFTFGSTTPFNANSTTPAFGSTPAPAQNMFGMNQTPSAQPSMFANPVQNQSAPSIFGSTQATNAPAPAMNLFGTPSVGATPTFGANPSIPSFEAPSLTPAPAPAFNFGAPQPTGVFGFGQQQQQQQPQMPQQAGVYSFGATPGAPQVQFNMGSAPNTTGVRRVRKAVRRNPQR